MSRARKKKEEMSGISLGVLSSGALAGAERSEGERSEPQRKRLPLRCRLRGRIPKWLPKRSGGPTQRNTNNGSCKRRKPLQRREVASAPFYAAKVCTRLC